ncbi:hypothetical protein ACET3Z_023253 [Daucus carota]
MEDLVALGQDGMGIDRGEGSAVDESVEVRLAVVDVDGSTSRRGKKTFMARVIKLLDTASINEDLKGILVMVDDFVVA